MRRQNYMSQTAKDEPDVGNSTVGRFMFHDEPYIVSFRRDPGDPKKFKVLVFDNETEETVSSFTVSDLNEGQKRARREVSFLKEENKHDNDDDSPNVKQEEDWEELF